MLKIIKYLFDGDDDEYDDNINKQPLCLSVNVNTMQLQTRITTI